MNVPNIKWKEKSMTVMAQEERDEKINIIQKSIIGAVWLMVFAADKPTDVVLL
jgi:hypothetical protein